MDGSSEDARSTAAAASSLEGQALRETLGKVNELLIGTSNPKIHDRCLAVVNSRANLQASVGTRIFEINVKTNRRVHNAGHSTSPACCAIQARISPVAVFYAIRSVMLYMLVAHAALRVGSGSPTFCHNGLWL